LNAYKTKKPQREDFLKRLVSIFSYRSLDDILSRAGFSTSIPIKSEPVAKASTGLFPQPFFIRGIFGLYRLLIRAIITFTIALIIYNLADDLSSSCRKKSAYNFTNEEEKMQELPAK
jgi:hypothetical protein